LHAAKGKIASVWRENYILMFMNAGWAKEENMITSLIFNADDYGRTPEVSRGIREAHRRGVVTSTTCMMNIPSTVSDIALALKETPALGLGVHLVLTADSPILPGKKLRTLTDEKGGFLKLGVLIAKINDVDVREVKAEWRSQIEAFIAATQRTPTHLDSHHHSSYFTPQLFRAMLELADEYDCAIRLPVHNQTDFRATGLPDQATQDIQQQITALIHEYTPRCPDGFVAGFYDEQATPEYLLEIISGLTGGVHEIMCHPGYCDSTLEASSSYAGQREKELAVLVDVNLMNAIQKRGVQLINFTGLNNRV